MIGRGRATVAGLVGLALLGAGCRLPTLKQEEARSRTLPQTSFVYAADGSLITSFHSEQNRVSVAYPDIPWTVRQAVIAIEDRRFYLHRGVDLKALLRALYVDARTGRIQEGGSTITEQYIKNRYLGSERTLKRKIEEAWLAWQLEHRLTKEAILTHYLNTVYFGHGAYGIQAAAKTYFSEPVTKLNLPQAALLAGLVQAPSDYEPIDHPRLARKRRNIVLRKMMQYGKISMRRYSAAVKSPLRLRPSVGNDRYRYPYFVQFVKDWFVSNPAFGPTRSDRENLLYQGGLRIYTTIEPRLQRDAEQAVNGVLLYRKDPYGAMTVIDPRSGEIKAMVGGRHFFSKHDPVAQVNLATGGVTGRQAGSTFKPFALVAALQNGISPEKTYPAPPSITVALPPGCQGPNEPVWSVTNFDGSGSGNLTVEQGTIDSVNVVYAQIVRDLGGGDPCLGARKIVATARTLGVNLPSLMRMGVGRPLQSVPSAVLGAEQVNTVEMATAYSTLANVGYRITPTPVTEVTDARGKVIFRQQPDRRLVVPPPVAYVTDQILQKVVLQGTGAAANFGRPAIGKTGTSENYHDAWFVGAVPQLAAAVWVGFPQGDIPMVAPRTRLPQVLGGTWPAQIWSLFMSKATKGTPVRNFPQPTSQYVTVLVDTSRNCLPNAFTPPYLIQPVTYLQGTQPTQRCSEPTSYQMLSVPSVVGMTQDEATTLLQNTGFQVAPFAQYSNKPVGTVVGQSPVAGSQALQSTTVTIMVSAGRRPEPPPCPGDSPTPSVSASPSASASSSPGATPSATPSASPTPCVSVGPSSSTGPGTPGPSPTETTVPDVHGLGQDEAIHRLQGAGFGVAVRERAECSGGAGCHPRSGVVWKENPDAGTKMSEGSTVTIWVNP